MSPAATEISNPAFYISAASRRVRFIREAPAAFAKTSPAGQRAAIPRELAGRPVEIWFQDEPSMRHSKAHRALEPLAHSSESQGMRIWAKRGTRGSCARHRGRGRAP